MHDVNVRAGELRKGHQVMHALRFDERRAALVVAFGTAHAGGEEFLLAFGDERFVLAMGGDDHAEFARQLERRGRVRCRRCRTRPCTRGRF